jgi:hypothetical protein
MKGAEELEEEVGGGGGDLMGRKKLLEKYSLSDSSSEKNTVPVTSRGTYT